MDDANNHKDVLDTTKATHITLPSSPHEEEDELSVPPTVPLSGISIQSHKLWFGNLDKRLTQQNILKFASPYGTIVSFKYLLHNQGVEKGEPRGYCFLEYSTREEAEKARNDLNGKLALGKNIIVDWARADQYNKKLGSAVSETWDASEVSATLQRSTSTAAKIAALEAKLLQMESDTAEPHQPYRHSTYTHDRARRKHGGNIKIVHPYTRTKHINKPTHRVI